METYRIEYKRELPQFAENVGNGSFIWVEDVRELYIKYQNKNFLR